MKKLLIFAVALLASSLPFAQNANNYIDIKNTSIGLLLIGLISVGVLLAIVIYSYYKFNQTLQDNKKLFKQEPSTLLDNLNSRQIDTFLKLKSKKCSGVCKKTATSCAVIKSLAGLVLLLFTSTIAMAQDANAASQPLMSQPGIIITIALLLLPVLLAVILVLTRARNALKNNANEQKKIQARELALQIAAVDGIELEHELEERKKSLDFSLSNQELSGDAKAEDERGIIKNVSTKHEVRFTALKRKATPRPGLDPAISKLVIWYLGCAAFWLVIGSGIGEYVGIKFVAPDVDHISWLSFGRLRPVHTNIVFWGWASLGILGLGYYVVPTVSNTKLYSIKWGWIALLLTNLQVTLGSISLMAGINNGGGEFREYIWPIMALFAAALILTLFNFIKTVAKRTTKEIYISNWFIISAIIFTIIIALTAYLPFWQNGLGETITQGYYMHSGVGMWFTLFTVGLLYYFIPQQLNRPIYAYSLGILAFWTQIIFYTVIGTHHFVFSAIPWWLQTVAIVGSVGMIIPVVAASINFFMTFKGQVSKVSNSYTLPFFLTAIVYYFVVSMQGTAEAFRFTNLLWHFTDFTVAHSHLGFYGIITFAIWGGSYAIVPRLTGKEPPQHLVGVHFWLAFTGLLLYAIPLMLGGTLKGLMWMEGKPFIDSVVKMFDYWIWRAIGGSLMFISHLIYFYNFYKMTYKKVEEIDVKEEAFRQLANDLQPVNS
ncbi:MAG: cbb3-type cytochrome c oxidase subunit I [Chitinophagaceae bacterium]